MYKIAAIGGDGIGPEIVAEGKKVLEAAGERFNFSIDWTDFDIGADRYLTNGELLTEDDTKELSKFRAIYFGAIGDERVKPGILEKGILLALRFHFDLYVNLVRSGSLKASKPRLPEKDQKTSTLSLSGRIQRTSMSGSVHVSGSMRKKCWR
jgi:isocitrate/isopropylmalate dehydrogenase